LKTINFRIVLLLFILVDERLSNLLQRAAHSDVM